MSSFSNIVKEVNVAKSNVAEKEDEKKKRRASFKKIVRGVNDGSIVVKSDLSQSEVDDWYKSTANVSERALSYLDVAQKHYMPQGSRANSLSKEITGYLEQADYVSQYLRANKSAIKDYDKVYDDHIKRINALRDLNEGLNKFVNYYSQWETEEDYNRDVAAQKDYERNATLDLEATQKEIKELEFRYAELVEALPSLFDITKDTPEVAEIRRTVDELNNKKTLYKKAKYVQEGIKYAGVADPDSEWYDPKFAEYAKTGKEYYDSLHPDNPQTPNYNFDQKVYRADYAEEVEAYSKLLNSFEYTNMTDNERAIYHYYLGKAAEEAKANGGEVSEEMADRYVNLIKEAINARHAKKMADEIAEEGKLLQLMFAAYSGIENWATGIENNFKSDDYIPATATAMASQLVREDMKEDGWGWGVAYDLTNTTANMFPSIAFSYVPVAGQYLSLASFGLSASGHAYAEAINNGYDKSQARTYSALVGGSEAGLQYLLGGIGSLGGKLSGNVTNKIATKITSNIGNAYAKIAFNSGTKLVGNMVSEFGEEYLQEILTPVYKNIALGTNEEFELFTTDALYAGFLGALSAGLLEGGSTIAGNVNIYKSGNRVIESGQKFNLAELGKTFSADTVAYKIADKVNENTDAYTFGQLLHEVGADSLSASNIADITAALKNEGMTLEDSQTIAKWLNKAVEGEYFSKSQREALENNEIIGKVFRDVILNKDSSVNQRVQGYQDVIQNIEQGNNSEKISTYEETPASEETPTTNVAPYSAEHIEAAAKGYSSEEAKAVVVADLLDSKAEAMTTPSIDNKYEVSSDGKTINITTGETVNVKRIANISKKGDVSLALDSGAVVKASDLSYGNNAEAIFIENISDIKIGNNPISATSANALYQAAMTSLNGDPNIGKMEAMSLIRGLAEAYVYGVYNLGESHLAKKHKNGKAIHFAGELSQTQRAFAYNLGVKDGEKNVSIKQKEIDAIKEKADKSSLKKKTGKIVFERDTKIDESNLTKTQKVNLDGIKLLAEISSIEFHVFVSDKTSKFKYTMPDGTVTTANGWFVAGTNEIWVDINAGNTGKGTMIWTAAHEISHYIKQWSPQKWKAMADLLIETFAKNGVDTISMINRQIAKIKKRYTNKNMPTDAKLLDMAYEELVCDALSDMLTDGSIVNFIAKVKLQDASLGKRLLRAIKNLLKRWNFIVEDYKGKNFATVEAQALAKFEDTFKKLQEMYRDALMDADNAYASIAGNNEQIQKNTTLEGDAKFMERDEGPTDFNPNGKSLKEQLKEAYDTAISNERRYVYVGDFTKKFTDKLKNHLNIKNYPVVMNYRDAYLSMESKERGKYHGRGVNYHNLGVGGLEAALKSFDNPEYVLLSATEGKIELILEGRDYKNRQLFSIVEINTKAQHNKKFLDAHVVNSVYGNRGIKNRIETAKKEGRVIYNKNEESTQGMPQVQYERDVNANSSNDSIPQTSQKSQEKQPVRDTIEKVSPEKQKSDPENPTSQSVIRFSERDFPIDSDVAKTVNNAFASSKGDMHILSEITAEQNKAINRLGNQSRDDVYRGRYEGGRHRFSDTAVRHIVSEHGDFLREGLRAQLPMTPKDIARHLSAIKDNKKPSNITPSRTKRGYPSILTSYEVNGYTLYAEEITRPLGKNLPSDLIGHTMYKAPTLATAAALATSARALPRRQSEVLCEYYMPNSTDLSTGNFVADTSGNPALMSYLEAKNVPKADVLLGGLIPLSSDSKNFTDKNGHVKQGYVVCKKPFHITSENRVFSNSDTNVAERINGLKRQGYDCFIFDKTTGDNYMVAVVNKAQIIENEPKVLLSERDGVELNHNGRENILHDDRDPNTSNRAILVNALEGAAQNNIERKRLAEYKEKISLVEAEEYRLAEIQKQLFTKGAVDSSQRRALQLEAVELANRINIYDRQLLNLEATAALKNVLNREKAKARKQQKKEDAEMLKKYRETAEKKTEAIIKHQNEIRQNAVMRREKTVMRHRIQKAVADLNRILNHGTKERNVKLELRDAVSKALTTAEVLFSNEITNADIVRLGVESVTEVEQKHLDKYAELLEKLEVANIYEEAKLKSQISALNSKLKDVFVRERARHNRQKVYDVLDSLASAYTELQNSKDDYVKTNAYTQGMYETITKLRDDLKGVTIRDMSLEQLTAVYEVFAMVKHMVTHANDIFREGRTQELSTFVSNVQMELSEIPSSTTDPKKTTARIANLGRSFSWNELKPYAAFERLGSQTFEMLFWDCIDADAVWATDIQEAAAFIENARKKNGYKTWDLQQTTTFKTVNGLDFKITLADMMSIYAYSKRKQAEEHMMVGGFTFSENSEYKDDNGKTIRVHKQLTDTYKGSLDLIADVVKKLSETPGAIEYVDEVQEYLTKIGEKGNEVSRIIYGIDIFNEDNYFPIKINQHFRSASEQQIKDTQTMASLKNIGMTKQITPHADNPIILKPFDDIVLEHINQMAKYHAYVIPIENLSRVFNNISKSVGNYVSTQQMINAKFGSAACNYFKQFITDLNGGSFEQGASNPLAHLFTTAKGVAVGANLSVVVQQYFAIIRAMDEINPKYFVPFLNSDSSKSDIKQYEELKKYAPVAIIKQIGGFDMGANRSAINYLGDSETSLTVRKMSQKTKDAAMWLPGKMDEIGWSTIWRAVKKEVAETTDLSVGTEEFYEFCGKRFTEIVVKTQVYDSVTSRNGFMRSKREGTKYLVSFMGEPTAIVNMLFTKQLELVRAFKSKDQARIKKAEVKLLRTGLVLVLSTVATSLAKSLPYAMRDDDEEEKSLIERWAKYFGQALNSDMNPLNLLPVLKDLVSIWEGWDVERPDTTLISELFASVKKLIDEGGTMDEAMSFAGALANMFGYPLKNVIRDVKGIVRLVGDVADDIQPTDVSGAFLEGFFNKDKTKWDKLYDAVVSGEKAKVDVLKSSYDTDDEYNNALANAIVANDNDIVAVASDYINGLFSSYDHKVDELISEGFNAQASAKAIRKVINMVSSAAQAKANGDVEDYNQKVVELVSLGYDKNQLMKDIVKLNLTPTDATERVESRWKKEDYATAVISGDTSMANVIKADYIAAEVQNGKTEEEAETTLESALNRGYREAFFAGAIDESRIEEWIKKYDSDKTDSDVYWELKKWKEEKEHQDDPDYSYSKYGEYYEAVINEDTRFMNAFKFEMQQHNNYKENVNSQVASDIASAITSHFKPIYIAASPSERSVLKRKLINAYATLGYATSKRSMFIDKWLTE